MTWEWFSPKNSECRSMATVGLDRRERWRSVSGHRNGGIATTRKEHGSGCPSSKRFGHLSLPQVGVDTQSFRILSPAASAPGAAPSTE